MAYKAPLPAGQPRSLRSIAEQVNDPAHRVDKEPETPTRAVDTQSSATLRGQAPGLSQLDPRPFRNLHK